MTTTTAIWKSSCFCLLSSEYIKQPGGWGVAAAARVLAGRSQLVITRASAPQTGEENEQSLAPMHKLYTRVRKVDVGIKTEPRKYTSVDQSPRRNGYEIKMVHQEKDGLNVEMPKLALGKCIWRYVCKMDNTLWKYLDTNSVVTAINLFHKTSSTLLALVIVIYLVPTMAVTKTIAIQQQSEDTLSNIPQTLSGECLMPNDCKKTRIQRPKSTQAQSCTTKCVTTCIRGGEGSPGEGPFNVRRPLVVFKQGFRSRHYCLVECSDICNLIKDGDDGP